MLCLLRGAGGAAALVVRVINSESLPSPLYWNVDVAENELLQGGTSETFDKLCGL